MLLHIVTILVGASLVTVLGHILLVARKNRRAFQFFKIKSPDFPVWSKPPNLFLGHMGESYFLDHNCIKIHELHRKLGTSVGLFLRDQPTVSTIDADLIKKFTLDEPNDHVNRINPRVTIHELEVDSIIFAEDDQWRRLRKAVAPAFS